MHLLGTMMGYLVVVPSRRPTCHRHTPIEWQCNGVGEEAAVRSG